MNPYYDYCLERIGGRGSDLYYGLLYLPAPERALLTALHALAREVADIGAECHDAALARTKLDWWRAETHNAFRRLPSHPVTHALQPAIAAGTLREEPLQELIHASTMDIAPVRFAEFADLHAHCRRTAGTVGALAVELLGSRAPALHSAAIEVGATHALACQLAALGADARRDRIYLPAADLDRFGVTEADILAARETAAVQALLAFHAERVRGLYDHALAPAPVGASAALQPAIIQAALDRALLDEIRHAGWRTLSQRIALTPLRRLWIAWRTQRRSKRAARLG